MKLNIFLLLALSVECRRKKTHRIHIEGTDNEHSFEPRRTYKNAVKLPPIDQGIIKTITTKTGMKVSAKKARKWARNRTTVMPSLTATESPTEASPVVQKPTENMSLLEKLKAKRTSLQTPTQSEPTSEPILEPVSEPQPILQMIQTPKRLKKARMSKAQIAAKYGAMMNVKPEKTKRPNKPLYAAEPKAIQYADWGERFGARARPSLTTARPNLMGSTRFATIKPNGQTSKFGPPRWQTTAKPAPFTKGNKSFRGVNLKSSANAIRQNIGGPSAFNLCLNGGQFFPGQGCLCVDNFAGDFCDECLPGWTGEQCDNPSGMCSIDDDSVDCSGKWLFNLTLLEVPTTVKKVNFGYNGLYKSGAVRKKLTYLNEIEVLNLNGNYISRFPLKMLANQPFIKELSVNSNFIYALPSDLFDYTEQLEVLDMKNNNIKELQQTIFYKTRSLRQIDFSNNNLDTICKGLFAYQGKIDFVAFNRNNELPLPLNKWFGTCPYESSVCDKTYPVSQYGGPVINMRKRIGAFGADC